jgi:DnaJ-like protein
MTEDPRLNAARYRVTRIGRDTGDTGEATEPDAEPREGPTVDQLRSNAEIAIQQAMRRGDFDDLPGAGKPLTGLTERHDPDWWIRQKIRNEQLTGLGPPALTLRTENAHLDERLDGMFREDEVRAALLDFNSRVIEARRQLLGGPPVVTPTRDVEAEVRAWRERRSSPS